MPHTLRQAAKSVGKDRTTILRAILSGKLSATRDEASGSWLIDAAELHRVYPPTDGTGESAEHHLVRSGVRSTAAQADIREMQIRLEAAEAGIKLRDEVIADLRQQRDREAEERRQAQTQLAEAHAKLTAVLVDQRPPPVTPAATARRWWQRRMPPGAASDELGSYYNPPSRREAWLSSRSGGRGL